MKKMLKYIVVLFTGSSFFFTSCSSDNNPVQNISRYPKAESQGIDPQGLSYAYINLLDNSYTQSLIVERNNVVVQEEYMHGATPEKYFEMQSVTKSITSLLIGI